MEIKDRVKYKTWGKSRSTRLYSYDYSKDRPVHVTICTYNKEKYFDSESNGKLVIDELLKTIKDLNFKILCYCLMPDHLHVVISPGESNLSLSNFLILLKGEQPPFLEK
jgi:REP element-mobilizing transposase RayT